MKKTIRNGLFLLIAVLFSTLLPLCAANISFAKAYDTDIDKEVILGGNPIGIIANSNGLLVTEFINVTTQEGSYSPALRAGLQKGDVIQSVNGRKTTDIVVLNEIIQQSDSPITLSLTRNEQTLTVSIEPEFDIVLQAKKIGIMLKNNVAGIGTITFVTKTGSFGALGHRIADSFGNDYMYGSGQIYNSEITGYKKATESLPGELTGKIDINSLQVGTMTKNSFSGIFGETDAEAWLTTNRVVQIGEKKEVKPGKATIFTTINGTTPEEYEIEIVRAFSQKEPSEKSMVLRVTDKRLLSTTGGILQGMSGSPIIQNNKLIGAVTHVFTNDTTMGYGIYIDWMIKEV